MVSSDDVQRLFLQAIFSRGILSENLTQALWKRCIAAVKAADDSVELTQPVNKADWDAFVVKINKSLDSLDLEFRHLLDESSGKEMYAVVNRKGDEIAQIATDYTPGEIAYFKAIIEQIMTAPQESFSVSSLAALREVSAVKPKLNMSKSQAETILGSFVAKGWLLKSKRGRYSLSTRSLLELQPYLKTTYPEEVLECTICLEIVTRGSACLTKNCKTRMHHHCCAGFRKRNTACPSCSQNWPKNDPLIPVGEGAARDGDDRRRQTRIRSAEASEDDEPSEEDEPAVGQSQRKSQRARKGKAPVNESMAMDEDEEDRVTPEASQRRRRSSRK